jgi:polysaccharide export outer membrane protein
MRLIYSYLVLGVLFICTSCSYKQYQPLFEQKKAIYESSLQNDTLGLNYYRIQPQDILQIRNLQDIKYIVNETATPSGAIAGGNASQGQSFQVEENGTVALPVIGHVKVVGLTRIEASKLIEDLYRKNLLVDPIIELKITNLKVTLLGEIRGPGNYSLTKDRTTLVEMIGTAGGLTESASDSDVKIIRGTEKDPKVTLIDLGDIRSINDPRAILQSGDIIYFAKNHRAVRTDNLQSFSSVFQPILLLFNTALIIFTLIHH